MFYGYLHITVNPPGGIQRETLRCHACKDKLYQNQPICLKQIGILKDYGLESTSLISRELNLSTYSVVIKQGKLQHGDAYDIIFRME